MAKTVHPSLDAVPDEERKHFIREWRKRERLSQERLGEMIGKTHSTVSQLERGIIEYTQGTLEDLAESLKCKPADLLSINPKAHPEVVDFTLLLRGSTPMLQQAALAAAIAVLQSNDENRPLRLYRPEDDDLDERPQNVGRSSRKESVSPSKR